MDSFTDKYEIANQKNIEGLPFIDNGKQKLFYRFTPSSINPIGSPLFIILHGHGTRAATRMSKKGWNVLAPIDHFGHKYNGSWYLGEDGDFFVKELLQKLIKKISSDYQCAENIYFYGSSMGGFGAILHGILCNARAVYANVPQIKLLKTTYSERSMKTSFSPIFSSEKKPEEENDLTHILSKYKNKKKLPLFFLCENAVASKGSHENYLQEHTNYFVHKCDEYGLPYHLELLPKSGHDKNYGLNEVLEKFNLFIPPLKRKIQPSSKAYPMQAKALTFEKFFWKYPEDRQKLQIVEVTDSYLDMLLDLSSQKNAAYIESIRLPVKENEKMTISVDAYFKHSKMSIYILEFDKNVKKIATKSFRLRANNNSIIHHVSNSTVSVQVLFRFENDKQEQILLKNLKVAIPSVDTKTIFLKHLQNIKALDIDNYLFTPYNQSDSYSFKPRKDAKPYKIALPMDWDKNPFNENNWMFQLHAMRLLDTEISQYAKTKEVKKLTRSIEVLLDWKRDILEKKEIYRFDKESDKDSFAWHDMATGTRATKIAYLFEALVILNDKVLFEKYFDDLYLLARLHINALSVQKIAHGNHAIFQIQGLLLLLRVFPEYFSSLTLLKEKTQKQMIEVFYNQFFKEGIHKENSSGYHPFITKTFKKILNKDLYENAQEIFDTLEKAEKNYGYMHFPNFESLMTGDSDFMIMKKNHKEEKITTGITHFNESGYTYIYEENDKSSMLYLDTAFLNRTHRHADFFNILLYEYDMNILVDAGKYSYVKDDPFRQYCISTRAHNVVMINNKDYKLDRKYFFTSKLVEKKYLDGHYYLQTMHHYDYLECTHIRHIYYKPMEFLLVVDTLNSKKIQNYKQIFHLHHDLKIIKKGGNLNSKINNDTTMHISMKSLNISENKLYDNFTYAKGKEGEIEGYRALGHNEVVNNYVLTNELDGTYVALSTLFSFQAPIENLNLEFLDKNYLKTSFNQYTFTTQKDN